MKVILTVLTAMVFILGATTGFAGEKCAKPGASCCPLGKATLAQASAPATAAEKTEAADPHAGCAEMDKAKTAETKEVETTANVAPAVAKMEKASEEICPDVTGRKQLQAFHESMHPMHMALEESDFAGIRKGMPTLIEASKGIAAYNCPDGDKCSAECKKAFETKKAAFMKSVEELDAACKGTDDAQVDQAFQTMHSAYIGFSSVCPQPKKSEASEKTE